LGLARLVGSSGFAGSSGPVGVQGRWCQVRQRPVEHPAHPGELADQLIAQTVQLAHPTLRGRDHRLGTLVGFEVDRASPFAGVVD
jgi:hypothetical protein